MNVCLVPLLKRQRVVVQDTRIQVQRNQTATPDAALEFDH